jgi:predicted O-methyltransferase YrrM
VLTDTIEAAYKIGMLQRRAELVPFCEWLAPRKLKNYLEIGVWKGGSFAVWDSLSQPGLHIGIDPNTQPGIILTPQQLATRQALFATLQPTVCMLMMNSRRQSTVQAVSDTLDGELLDFLFIDGDHGQPACHHDFIRYGRFVRHGGVIALHDIALYPGCKSVWQSVQQVAAETRTFIDTTEPSGIGAWVKR